MKAVLLISVFLKLIVVASARDAQPGAPSAVQEPKPSGLTEYNESPTRTWPTAAPETCGVDTNHLARSLEQLPKVCPSLHSLLVVRHGRLIIERYFGGTQPQDAWDVKSVTKSMVGALVGIGLERGYIRRACIQYLHRPYSALWAMEQKPTTLLT